MKGLIEPRLPEVGRIRLGTRERSRGGKLIPATSETLIFSSASRGTLVKLAERVGGTVEEWDGPDAYRVISGVATLAVQVPPQMLRAPSYEAWTAGGLLRRCDGETCEVPESTPNGPILVTGPCVCGPGRSDCKLTLRLSVVIPWAPGLGVWLVTTHSTIAGAELEGQRRLLGLAQVAGLVPATIAIDPERTRRGSMVPVLRVRYHTALDELGGGARSSCSCPEFEAP